MLHHGGLFGERTPTNPAHVGPHPGMDPQMRRQRAAPLKALRAQVARERFLPGVLAPMLGQGETRTEVTQAKGTLMLPRPGRNWQRDRKIEPLIASQQVALGTQLKNSVNKKGEKITV